MLSLSMSAGIVHVVCGGSQHIKWQPLSSRGSHHILHVNDGYLCQTKVAHEGSHHPCDGSPSR